MHKVIAVVAGGILCMGGSAGCAANPKPRGPVTMVAEVKCVLNVKGKMEGCQAKDWKGSPARLAEAIRMIEARTYPPVVGPGGVLLRMPFKVRVEISDPGVPPAEAAPSAATPE